jgi:hypothetical protein
MRSAIPLVVTALRFVPPAAGQEGPRQRSGKDARFRFQADSITDGRRGRAVKANHIPGHGYVFLVAARLDAAFPEMSLGLVNRGVSGNTVLDLEKHCRRTPLT